MESEFVPFEKMVDIFLSHGLVMGRMITTSKSKYRDEHPNHKVVYNANIVTERRGKIWYGDLDLTLDGKELKLVAEDLQEPVYVLREMDARFENEKLSPAQLIERAVICYK